MNRRRQLLAVVLFGVGSGAAIETASHGSMDGWSAIFAIIIAGSLLASLGVVVHLFAKWPLEYQVASISSLALVGFFYWSAWLTGPFMITSDLRVIGETGGEEINTIRAASIGLLLLYGMLFLFIVKRKGRSSVDT